MSQAAEAYTTNVIPFRRAANDRKAVEPFEMPEPSAIEINCVLVTCLITGLSQRAKSEFYGRLQKMYDRADGNPHRRSLVVAAAECVAAPLKRGAN